MNGGYFLPPCIDLYVLTDKRTEATVQKFLNAYVDVERERAKREFELQMAKLNGFTKNSSQEASEYEYKFVDSFDAALEEGFKEPWRAFSLYCKSSKPELCDTIITFTSDGKLVLGLSVDYADESEIILRQTKKHLLALSGMFETRLGFTAVEYVPPTSEALFIDALNSPSILSKLSG